MQQARVFQVSDVTLAQNLRGFVQQCVAYDIHFGKYSLQDVKHTDDLWGLVSQKPSPLRRFLWQPLKGAGPHSKLSAEHNPSRPTLMTCKQGVQAFNAQWGSELQSSLSRVGKKLFGLPTTGTEGKTLVDPTQQLKQYLPIAYSALAGISREAEDIMKQQIMIAALVEGFESQSVVSGNPQNLAIRQAYLQQRQTHEAQGVLAPGTISTLYAVLQCLLYALFLFLPTMAVIPMGYLYIWRWVQGLVWITLWAPLYALLNFIMTLRARGQSMG